MKKYYLTYGDIEDGRILAVISSEHPRESETVRVLSCEAWPGPLTKELVAKIHEWFDAEVIAAPWVLRN